MQHRIAPLSEALVDRLLTNVEKPARYIGGEVGSVCKSESVRCRAALCFPDMYEVAESHIGLKILYEVINKRPDFAAERVYALWPDLERKARATGVPLWSLETRLPLRAFDVVGITLQYELSYPTMLAMLDHGGIELRAERRPQEAPFVIAGGIGAYNPEPVAPFFDAFLLGDGEEAVLEILETVAAGREGGQTRAQTLKDFGSIKGVYVPLHFGVTYRGLSVDAFQVASPRPNAAQWSRHGAPRVARRVVRDITRVPYPAAPVLPNIKPVHDRLAVEIQRGCSQACRFCQAGMVTRPTRQRHPSSVLSTVERSLPATGADEVGFLSLSAGDYAPLNEILTDFLALYSDQRVSMSLPSMRTETLSPEVARHIATVRKSGFTLAPEAGTDRLRAVINKKNTDDDLLRAVRNAVSAGWRLLKLYFMIGLPTETDEDADAIVGLAVRARAAGRSIRPDVSVTVSLSTFVPKPHTPFQWERQVSLDETRARQQRIRAQLRRMRIACRYHSPEQSFVEGVLSRGDRRLAPAMVALARAGCRLDAWTEHYRHEVWIQHLQDALSPHGMTPADYLSARAPDALLPWDHLDAGILKKHLLRERSQALCGVSLDDCAKTGRCHACGGCDLGDPYLSKAARAELGDSLLRPIVHQPGRGATEALPFATAESKPDLQSVPAARSRIRFRFAKRRRAVHLSHLDAMDHILRAVRQVRLPVLYSQGHTPRPRLSFSPACPTGIESNAEFFEARCVGYPDPERYASRLSPLLPEGMDIVAAEGLRWDGPTISEEIVATTYRVAPGPHVDRDGIMRRVDSFLDRAICPVRVMRKKKPRVVDARALLPTVTWDGASLGIRLLFQRTATLKVREAVAILLGQEALDGSHIAKLAVDLGERGDIEESSDLQAVDAPHFDLTHLRMTESGVAQRSEVGAIAVPYAE